LEFFLVWELEALNESVQLLKVSELNDHLAFAAVALRNAHTGTQMIR
jgi:hypothetical protein